MIAHLVTDRHRLASQVDREEAWRCLLAQAQFAIEAGVDCIQIRERDLEALALAELTTEVLDLTRGTGTRVVLNDRLDVALACGADGVHLRADSMPVAAARRLAPRPFLIGRSVHSVQDAVDAAGADYLIAGTVWQTVSKSGHQELLGIQGLQAIVNAVRVPVLAIGGVTAGRARDVARAGGAGLAAIGLFMDHALGGGCRAVPLDETLHVIRRMFDTSGSDS